MALLYFLINSYFSLSVLWFAKFFAYSKIIDWISLSSLFNLFTPRIKLSLFFIFGNWLCLWIVKSFLTLLSSLTKAVTLIDWFFSIRRVTFKITSPLGLSGIPSNENSPIFSFSYAYLPFPSYTFISKGYWLL